VSAFSIQCPTCRAKLKVAKVSAIGQTLSCPRCASMVEVVPPEGWSATADSPSQASSAAKGPLPKMFESDSMDQLLDGMPAVGAKPKSAHPEDMQETIPSQFSGQFGTAANEKQEKSGKPFQSTNPNATGAKAVPGGNPTSKPSLAGPYRNSKPSGNSSGKTPGSADDSKSVRSGALKPGQWDSENAKRRRTILVAVVGGVGLLVIGGGLGMYLLSGDGDQVAKTDGKGAQVSAENPGTDPPVNADAVGKDSAGQDLAAEKSAKIGDPVDGASEESGGGNGANAAKTGSGNGSLSLPVADANSDQSISGTGKAEPTDLAGAGVVSQPTTEGSTPDSFANSGVNDGLNGDQAQKDQPDADSFDKVISDIFGGGELTNDWEDPGLLDVRKQTSKDPTEEVIRKLASKGPTRTSPSARVSRPRQRSVNVKKSLEATVLGINNDQMLPLQLIDLLERLSSVPIWIDSDRYQAAPVSLDVPAPINAINLPTQEILSEKLATFGLGVEVADLGLGDPSLVGLKVFPLGTDQIVERQYAIPAQNGTAEKSAQDGDALEQAETNASVISAPSEVYGKLDPSQDKQEADPPTAPKQSLDPLVNGADSPESDPLGNADPTGDQKPGNGLQAPEVGPLVNDPYVALVVQLIRDYVHPSTWALPLDPDAAVDGVDRGNRIGEITVRDGKIVVKHYPAVQQRVQRLLDQLQASLETKANKMPWPKKLQPRVQNSGDSFGAIIDLEFYLPTPLRTMFQELNKQSGMTILIDWPSLIAQGWTPDTQVPWIAKNESVEVALNTLALDMGLTYQIVAPNIACLMSYQGDEGRLDAEIYPASDLINANQNWAVLKSRLQRLLNDDLARSKSSFLYYDENFGSIVAKLPQSGHRRLSIYMEAARKVVRN